jgi:hypothetical protein
VCLCAAHDIFLDVYNNQASYHFMQALYTPYAQTPVLKSILSSLPGSVANSRRPTSMNGTGGPTAAAAAATNNTDSRPSQSDQPPPQHHPLPPLPPLPPTSVDVASAPPLGPIAAAARAGSFQAGSTFSDPAAQSAVMLGNMALTQPDVSAAATAGSQAAGVLGGGAGRAASGELLDLDQRDSRQSPPLGGPGSRHKSILQLLDDMTGLADSNPGAQVRGVDT